MAPLRSSAANLLAVGSTLLLFHFGNLESRRKKLGSITFRREKCGGPLRGGGEDGVPLDHVEVEKLERLGDMRELKKLQK
eukprot:1354220-Amorphochlora_amoeboformis.AAC.1